MARSIKEESFSKNFEIISVTYLNESKLVVFS